MGTRDKEVGTPTTPQSEQNLGKPNRKDERFEKLWTHLSSQLGELSVVAGATKRSVQQSDYRRIESLQGFFHEAIQGAEKTLKELRTTYYSDRHTDTSRNG